MKYFTIVSVVISLVLSSCASVFSPKNQDVTVFTKNKNTKVFVNDKFQNQGDSVVANVVRDAQSKQLKFELDSCKTEYRTIIQDAKSKIFILSVIPFGILIFPMIFDEGNNTWIYNHNYYLDSMSKLNYWNPDKKRLFLRNVSININHENHIYNSYRYSDYKQGYEPRRTEKFDSIGYKNTVYEESLVDMLKKTNYIDTTKTVFIDNVNTLTLRCVVNRLVLNQVWRRYNEWAVSNFVIAEVTADWILEDIYGDTLLNQSFSAKSGEFSIGHYKVEDVTKNAVSDALEECLITFLDNQKIQEFLVKDTTKIIGLEKLSLTKPTKIPEDIETAMEATVTIKSDEGHGSGFLVSNDGYIITNHHVVSKDRKYKVVTKEGKEYDLKVVRSNKIIDIALVKIEGEFEYAFPIPEIKNFKTGQEIFAIGTPNSVELGQSISKGIVSGMRTNNELNYVQTDVSINRGNSGGAVVSPKGELVGVVEYKLLGLGLEGLSFAIPAYDIMKSLSIGY